MEQVRLLIIGKDLNKLQKAAQFLTRRGWPTDAIGSVKQAVEYVVKFRPTYVLVSMSHPNPNVAKLPNLLAQTFNAQCIAFGESSDPKTMQRMNSCKLKHVFYGAMSGPTIHMRIKKILLDEQKEKERLMSAAQQPQNQEQKLNAEAPAPAASVDDVDSHEPTGAEHAAEMSMASANSMPENYQPRPMESNSAQPSPHSMSSDPSMADPQGSFASGDDGYWSKKKNYGADAEPDYVDYSEQKAKKYGLSDPTLQGEPSQSMQQPPGDAQAHPSMNENSSMDAHQGLDAHPFHQEDHHQNHPDSQAGPMASDSLQGMPFDESSTGAAGHATHPEHAGQAAANPLNGAMPHQQGAHSPSGPGLGAANDPSLSAAHAESNADAGSMMPSDAAAPSGSFGSSPFGDARKNHEAQMRQDGYMPAEESSPASSEMPGMVDDASASGQFAENSHESGVAPSSAPGEAHYHAAEEPMGAPGEGRFSENSNSGPSLWADAKKPGSPHDQGPAENTAERPESEGPEIRKASAPVMEYDDDPADPFVNPGDVFFDPPKNGMPVEAGVQYTVPEDLLEDLRKMEEEPGDPLENFDHSSVDFREGLDPDNHLMALAAVIESGFRNACQPNTTLPKKVSQASTVGIITAKYENKMGYILVAFPQESGDTQGFLHQVKKAIEEQKDIKNVKIRLHAEFYSQIDTVEFVDWAKNIAEFVSNFQHQDMEVAMAFISTSELPVMNKSAELQGMYCVALESIVPDIPVNYEGYINMKKNDKLIQYIKNGRSISARQKDRLKAKQVESIYIKAKDTENFKAHYASALLNNLIKQYSHALETHRILQTAS